MMFFATLTASLVTNSGRTAWFVGVLLLMVYLVFAMSLYLMPPQESQLGKGVEAIQQQSK
jgi:Ca2+:H+ antiporter